MGAVGATGRPLVIGETFRPGDDYSVGGQVYSGNTGQVIGNLGQVERVSAQEAAQRDQRLAEQRQRMEKARADQLKAMQDREFTQQMAQRQQVAASQSSVPATASTGSPQQRASVEQALARYQQEQASAQSAAEQRLAKARAQEAEMRNRAQFEQAQERAAYDQARSARERARSEFQGRLQRGIAGIDKSQFRNNEDYQAAIIAGKRADLEKRRADLDAALRQVPDSFPSQPGMIMNPRLRMDRISQAEDLMRQQNQQSAPSAGSPEGFQLDAYEQLLKRLQSFRGNQ